ncbi:MAG: ATP-binding protein [Pseudomonadota bacterium]
MMSWSLNDVYLVSSVVLLILSFLLLASRRTYLVWQLALAIASLSLWNFCSYLVGERMLPDYISLVSRVQLVAILLFGTGLFNFCASFPDVPPNRWQWSIALISSGFVAGLLFTRGISDAVYEADGVRYTEGFGFTLFTLYLCVMAVLVFSFLFRAWRLYPEQRSKLRYFITGVGLFVACGSFFNLVLPIFNQYDYLVIGRLSCTVAALLFFYAIAKDEFLDVTVIINKHVAWAVSLQLLAALALVAYQFADGNQNLEVATIVLMAWTAALVAGPLQKFLLTSAKRRFIKGWYEPDEVFRRLGDQLTQETNRETIFRKSLSTLDEVFELEETLSIVAVRDSANQLSGYKVQEQLRMLAVTDALIVSCKDRYVAIKVEDADEGLRVQLRELLPALRDKGVIIPFHSPEFLEGILVLGTKSSGAEYNLSDLLFFNNLINYLSPLLYRLTPIETLERLYNENQRKLHDAEIQLLRAQKIESIVHATRQCHHEIRTPLNIIRLGLGRIKTMEDLENYKLIAREEIDHAITIVEETLAISDVSKPASRQFTEVNIIDVINRCLRLIDRSRYRVNLDLQEVPPIKGIFSDLQVVITNLIHNALEAMPDGGTLFFSTLLTGGNIVIRVEDTGEGIPLENRTRVWEPYFSGKGGAVGNSTAGRGWGLTIVHRIVNEHAGTIHLTSEVGVGTCFIITLPPMIALSAVSAVAPAAARA